MNTIKLQNFSSKRILLTIVRYEIKESLRNFRLLIYTGVLAVFGFLILHFSGNSPKAAASILNLSMLVVPLFGMLFGALSFRDSIPFIQLMLSRGISRTIVYAGKWLGLSVSLGISVAAGLGFAAIFAKKSAGMVLLLLVLSVFLQFVFVSLAMLLGVIIRKREVIPGIVLLFWFYLYVIYDLIVLFAGTFSNEYPLEIPILALLVLNPLDLVRLAFLIQSDLSSLMGFSTAVAVKFMGGSWGRIVAVVMLLAQTAVPLYAGLKLFQKRDL